jgi:hypothetical protein
MILQTFKVNAMSSAGALFNAGEPGANAKIQLLQKQAVI